MKGRDPGYDDWFDDPEPPTEEATRGRVAYEEPEEVWVVPEDDQRRARRRSGEREIVVAGLKLTTTQAAIIAAAVLAVFVGILAAAGVFGSSPSTTPPPTANQGTTSTLPTATAPTSPLKPGDTGSQVKVLQGALNALGFSVGKPDGFYGPKTQSAVEQFQSSKGLTTDGIVGPATLAALQQALSG